ncbi:hypothetical protein KAFR_0B06110 [Kazachstania africana CBS 2517]|uniref:Something about silencing protein 4 domain-containing protein n=1 Tax=Kazachstania africana (strain ATCC 22294 / BCRC 22015 / CBS 2517 / CECT 1963 / NBRC 1671 / NRRL Y-8276) TaxID=1071382 RepID=H2ARA7_KAZAF|nr:hypothetical protein KAFR_0B06110 [Kazachstania africana CBS 2517]CCF56907.1 hypothetical protein KAFR_0B06110 [Kazachstania africana CBS 2517]
MEDLDLESARSLRSKSKGSDDDRQKFDFDMDGYEIDPEKRFKFAIREVPKGLTHSEGIKKESKMPNKGLANVDETRDLITNMILNIDRQKLDTIRKRSKNDEYLVDPLPDKLYDSFHKKMLRQENRMLEQDVIEGEEEADGLQLIYDKLCMPNWPQTLSKVTKINDQENMEELQLKKKLTRETIKSMLDKFHLMKKNSNMLYKNRRISKNDSPQKWTDLYKHVNRRFVQNYESSSEDEEEENLPIEELRNLRKKRREAKCGGSIIIGIGMNQLVNKFAIVSEPLRKPYVIRCSAKEKSLMRKVEKLPKRYRYLPSLRTQTAKFKQKTLISRVLTIETPIESKPKRAGNTLEAELRNTAESE